MIGMAIKTVYQFLLSNREVLQQRLSENIYTAIILIKELFILNLFTCRSTSFQYW